MTYGTIFRSRHMIASLSFVRMSVSSLGRPAARLRFFLLTAALRLAAGLQRGVVRRFLGLLSGADNGVNGSVQ